MRRRKLPSLRHKSVKRLVVFSLFITGLFGLNSYYYSLAENKLSMTIENIESFSALKSTIVIDKLTIFSQLATNVNTCTMEFPLECELYFTSLLQIRNRLMDYRTVLVDTFDLSTVDKLYSSTNEVTELIDLVASDAFNLSFDKAKSLNIATAKDYIYASAKQNVNIDQFSSLNEKLATSIDTLFEDIDKWISNQDPPITELSDQIYFFNNLYLVLIISETVLFLTVCFIDVLNNNLIARNAEVES